MPSLTRWRGSSVRPSSERDAVAKKRPGEFALIERYFRPLAPEPGAFALADDAALYGQRPGDDLVRALGGREARLVFNFGLGCRLCRARRDEEHSSFACRAGCRR